MSWWENASKFITSEAATMLEKAKEAALEVKEKASKLSDTVQAEYQRTFVELDCQILNIENNFKIMEFPTPEKIERLSKRLNEAHPERMLIFNMSEKPYDKTWFQAEFVDVAFNGLPSPPLELLFELCLTGHTWLSADSQNVLVLHCTAGYARSLLFASCFLIFRGKFTNALEATRKVCDVVSTGSESALAFLPSQRRYVTYFQECQQGISPLKKKLRLVKARLNSVPEFETSGGIKFRPYIEVWNHGELVFTSSQAAADEKTKIPVSDLPPAYGPSDSCVSFQLPEHIIISGDVLIAVRHVFGNGSRELAFRVAFHTGLVPNSMQVAKRDLDGASEDKRFSEELFLDLALESDRAPLEGDECTDEVSPVFAKARAISQQLREAEEEWLRLQAVDAKAVTAAAEGDEVAALEATLLRGAAGATAASSQATGRANAQELQRALAAAAADEEVQSSKDVAQSAKMPARGSAPTGTSTAAKDASIDELFSEFDAAMGDSVTGGLSSAPTSSPDKIQTSPAKSLPEKVQSSPAKSDVFADVDAFLSELDSSLAK